MSKLEALGVEVAACTVAARASGQPLLNHARIIQTSRPRRGDRLKDRPVLLRHLRGLPCSFAAVLLRLTLSVPGGEHPYVICRTCLGQMTGTKTGPSADAPAPPRR